MFQVDLEGFGIHLYSNYPSGPQQELLEYRISRGDFCYLFQVENVLAGDAILFLSCSTADLEVRISTPDESV